MCMNKTINVAPQTSPTATSKRLNQFAGGFILAVLAWAVVKDFGLEVLPLTGNWADDPLSYWGAGLIGGVLISTRARFLLWIFGGLTCLAMLGIISTPLVMRAARGLVRTDPLQHSNAIYVLGGGIHEDGTPDDSFQQRVLHAYELLGQGYAPTLVVASLSTPQLKPAVSPYAPFVRRQMRELRLRQPILEIGPVANTFDEAEGLAKLARQHRWKRIILVSSPTHMRRVAAVFNKAIGHSGVAIICSPCVETRFDLASSGRGGVLDRIHAFRTWMHETIGYKVYKLRGRI